MSYQFSWEQTQTLSGLYEAQPILLDKLPYTDHFDDIYTAFSTQYPLSKFTKREVFQELVRLRKCGRLARKTARRV